MLNPKTQKKRKGRKEQKKKHSNKKQKEKCPECERKTGLPSFFLWIWQRVNKRSQVNSIQPVSHGKEKLLIFKLTSDWPIGQRNERKVCKGNAVCPVYRTVLYTFNPIPFYLNNEVCIWVRGAYLHNHFRGQMKMNDQRPSSDRPSD